MTRRVYRGRTNRVIAKPGPIPAARELRKFRPEFLIGLRCSNRNATKLLGALEASDKLGECLRGAHWDLSAACGSTRAARRLGM